jgi:hypothetical protein
MYRMVSVPSPEVVAEASNFKFAAAAKRCTIFTNFANFVKA